MNLTPADVALVRRLAARLWRTRAATLPSHELEECVSRVLLVLVKVSAVERLEPYAYRVVVSVLRVMRREHHRARGTELALLGVAQRLPLNATVPVQGWGGARAGAGRPRNTEESGVRNSR